MTFTDAQVYEVYSRLILTYEPMPVEVCRQIMEAAVAMLIKTGTTTAEQVIADTLGPANWQAWIGEDFPARCAEALRQAGKLKEGE